MLGQSLCYDLLVSRWNLPPEFIVPFIIIVIVFSIFLRKNLKSKTSTQAALSGVRQLDRRNAIQGLVVTALVFVVDAVAGFPSLYDIGGILIRIGYVAVFFICAYTLARPK